MQHCVYTVTAYCQESISLPRPVQAFAVTNRFFGNTQGSLKNDENQNDPEDCHCSLPSVQCMEQHDWSILYRDCGRSLGAGLELLVEVTGRIYFPNFFLWDARNGRSFRFAVGQLIMQNHV